jgi:hypothetical protein
MANVGELFLTIKSSGGDKVRKELQAIESASQRAAKAMDSARGPGNAAEVAERNAAREMAANDKMASKAVENAQRVELARIKASDKAFEAEEKARAKNAAAAEKAAAEEQARQERINRIRSLPITTGVGKTEFGAQPGQFKGGELFKEQKTEQLEFAENMEKSASAMRMQGLREAKQYEQDIASLRQNTEKEVASTRGSDKGGESFVSGFRKAFRTFAMGAMATDFAASVAEALAVGLTTEHGIIGQIAAAKAIPIVGGIVKASEGIADAMTGETARKEERSTAQEVYQLALQTMAVNGDQFSTAQATALVQHDAARQKYQDEVASNQISQENANKMIAAEDRRFMAVKARLGLQKELAIMEVNASIQGLNATRDILSKTTAGSQREDLTGYEQVNALLRERAVIEANITDGLREQKLIEKDAQIMVAQARNAARVAERDFQRGQASQGILDEISNTRLLMQAKMDEARITELQASARREAARMEREGDIEGARNTRNLANEKIKLIKIEQDRAKVLADNLLQARGPLMRVTADDSEGDKRRLEQMVQIKEMEAQIVAERVKAGGSVESKMRLDALIEEKTIRQNMMDREIELEQRRLTLQRHFAAGEIEALRLRTGHQADAATELEAKVALEKKIADIKMTARKEEQNALIAIANGEFEAKKKARQQEKTERIDDIRAQTALNLAAASGAETGLQARILGIREDFRKRERDAKSDDERKALQKLERSEEARAIKESLSLKTVGSQEAKFTAFLGGKNVPGITDNPLLEKQLDALNSIERNTRNSIARAA